MAQDCPKRWRVRLVDKLISTEAGTLDSESVIEAIVDPKNYFGTNLDVNRCRLSRRCPLLFIKMATLLQTADGTRNINSLDVVPGIVVGAESCR